MDDRAKRLIVPAIVVAGLVALAIAAPEIYTGTFSDAGTFLRVMGFVVVLAAWAFAMRRWVRPPALAMGLAAVPILVFTWIYVWPYLRPPTEVDEAFPPTAADVGEPAAAEEPAEEPATEEPETDEPPTSLVTTTTAPAPDTTASPDADAADVATESTGPPPTTTTPSTVPPPTTTTTTVPAGPVELRRSTFQGLTGHRGSGDAAVYRLVDSSILLRFEEVDIGSGPDLDVYLVPGEDRRGIGDGIYVADLTAERGNQNYTVPDGVDITTGTWTVLVWCETFDVEVANATLA